MEHDDTNEATTPQQQETENTLQSESLEADAGDTGIYQNHPMWTGDGGQQEELLPHEGVTVLATDGNEHDLDTGRTMTDIAENSAIVPQASADIDDDNWSRQVETDGIYRVPSSMLDYTENETENESEIGVVLDSSRVLSSPVSAHRNLDLEGLAPPRRIEPTLKEQLVERERQRRVETERARLRRQFALRSNEESVTEEQEEDLIDGDDDNDDDYNNALARENGSVAGTVGEGSVVAPVDVLMEDDAPTRMSYPMERFLQEQGTILEEDPSREVNSSNRRDSQNQGVVMERFLQVPVVVGASNTPGDPTNSDVQTNVDRSVSFEAELLASQPITSIPSTPLTTQVHLNRQVSSMGMESLPEVGPGDYANDSLEVGVSIGPSSLANASMDCIASEVPRPIDLSQHEVEGQQRPSALSTPSTPIVVPEDSIVPQPESPSLSQPRVLGLTQAEIEEMEAIEEVSQQNAPPSERDDLSTISFVGELVSDFGVPGGVVEPHGGGTTSQGTPTTAMESASIFSGNQSAPPTVSEHAGGDGQHSVIDSASVNSHLVASSSVGGGVSVTANPPSELGHDDAPISPLPDIPTSPLREASSDSANNVNIVSRVPPSIPLDLQTDDWADLATLNAGVVNRQIRPGMVNRLQARANNNGPSNGSPVRRVMSVPNAMHFDLDGFDYDKNAPLSPMSGLNFSSRDHPSSVHWSPGSRLSFERSPFLPRTGQDPERAPDLVTFAKYGATENSLAHLRNPSDGRSATETEPFIPSMPNEIVVSPRSSRVPRLFSMGLLNRNSWQCMVEETFCDIRKGYTQPVASKEAKHYQESGLFQRALSDRLLVLAATLLVEIPVLLMISGGSNKLCSLVGRSRYQLLMGFLPVACAISGNVGLQASNLTTCSIAHGHVTIQNYKVWLLKEIGTAVYLGLGIGSFLGLLAFVMGGWNCSFSLAVMLAQFISVSVAGLTGTLAPLLVGFVSERDIGKWGLPLLTAIQDIVGSVAMVILSYKLLELIGPLHVEAWDTCSSQNL